MSTLQPTTDSQDRAEAQRRLEKIRDCDREFRNQMRIRIEELSSSAGAAALEFLLHPEKTEAQQLALSTNARGNAINNCLSRYLSALRHYTDIDNAVAPLRAIIELLESLRESQRGEAQAFALKNLTGPTIEIADGRHRLAALNSHAASVGTDEFVQSMRTMFSSVL